MPSQKPRRKQERLDSELIYCTWEQHLTWTTSGTAELNPPPQFKLDIKNAPIQEEEGDVNAALADMANTLRAVSLLFDHGHQHLTVCSKPHHQGAREHCVDDGTSATPFLYLTLPHPSLRA